MPVPRGAPVTRARPFILRCARHSTRATRGLRFATVRQDGCRRFLGSWSLLRESSARDVDRAILGDVAARCAVPVLAAEMSPARWPSVRAHRCARPSVSRGLRPLIGRSAGRTPFEIARETDRRPGRAPRTQSLQFGPCGQEGGDPVIPNDRTISARGMPIALDWSACLNFATTAPGRRRFLVHAAAESPLGPLKRESLPCRVHLFSAPLSTVMFEFGSRSLVVRLRSPSRMTSTHSARMAFSPLPIDSRRVSAELIAEIPAPVGSHSASAAPNTHPTRATISKYPCRTSTCSNPQLWYRKRAGFSG